LALSAKIAGFYPYDGDGEPDDWEAVPPLPTLVHDARLRQAEAESEAAFFARHSFVLLRHGDAEAQRELAAGGPLSPRYEDQIRALIRQRLLPGIRIEFQKRSMLLRRGDGTRIPYYGTMPHQDYGPSPDDFQASMAAYLSPETGRAWRRRYESDDVEGFMMINFWRTTAMSEPLRHMPLAVCDPMSISLGDIVEMDIGYLTPSGIPVRQLGLRGNRGQIWYHYPGMESGEVLAFKVFQFFKQGDRDVFQSCFHTAFADPTAPPDAAPRQSCEHRFGLFCLKPDARHAEGT
jgi:hypothetical protein